MQILFIAVVSSALTLVTRTIYNYNLYDANIVYRSSI